MQFFILQLLIDTQSFTLIHDTAVKFNNKTIMFISLNFLRLKNCMLLLLAQYSNDDVVILKDLKKTLMVYKNPAIIASRNINSKIDSKNVILEEMKHIKKQKY